MGALRDVYGGSLALLTDLYELTMAYGYWKAGIAEQEAVFALTFRRQPFGGGFSIACGLGPVVELLEGFRFDEQDAARLAALAGDDGRPLFEPAFLDFLLGLRFACDVDAVPEGTAVFPHEPLVRVRGPILQAQILETHLLTLLGFQTLVATKAARVCLAAEGDPVVEFGLRRAQGFDGGLSASRAAYVGGCAGTSNVLAGQLFGIPVKGTHAHSWVTAFDDELAAFRAYAEAMPNNCILLVDTYDTLQGVRHAVEVGRELRARGGQLAGVRLDSGDLAYLSVEARKILDAAEFQRTRILASNDLDEHVVASLKQQRAAIDVWGVGTRLATAHGDPALTAVYKLTALREPDGNWRHPLKLSEQVVKITTPGVLQVRRYRTEGEELAADLIYDELLGIEDPPTLVDPADLTRRKTIEPEAPWEDLLVPVFRGGQKVYDPPEPARARERAAEQLRRLHPGIKRFINPHQYPVGLEKRLHELKTELVLGARDQVAGARREA
jgi:nicotinate phosphoribosyltransferase